MRAVASLLFLLAMPAMGQDQEDDAHRADRLRTQELNRRSPNGYAKGSYGTGNDQGAGDYAQAQAEYRERLAEWRRRVAACESGHYDACER